MATKTDKTGLKPKQRKLAEMLANPEYSGTITEICQACEIARTTFYKWMDLPKFRGHLNDLIGKYADSELSTVWKALVRKCATGDVQAMRLYFEMREKTTNEREGGVQIIDDV